MKVGQLLSPNNRDDSEVDKRPFDSQQGQILEMRAQFLLSLQRGDLMRIPEKAVDFFKYREILRKMGRIPADRWEGPLPGSVLPGVGPGRPPTAERRRKAAGQSAPGDRTAPFWGAAPSATARR